jgi:hypothetical protein
MNTGIPPLATNPNAPAPPGVVNECPDQVAEVAELAVKVERCRRLAAGVSDPQAAEVLRSMARHYEQRVAHLSGKE